MLIQYPDYGICTYPSSGIGLTGIIAPPYFYEPGKDCKLIGWLCRGSAILPVFCTAMKNKLLAYVLLLFFAHIQVPGLYAQKILALQHISVENGLSQSTVYSILQDKKGFIWFATGDGINRYDGRTFIPYKTRFSDSQSVYPKDRNVNSRLYEDKYGRIWFNSDAGLSYIDIRHRRSKLVYNNTITGNGILLPIVGDTVWVAAHDKGLVAIDINNLAYALYRFGNSGDSATNIINAAIQAPGGIWVADHKGLLFFDRTTRSLRRKLTNENIFALHLLPGGDLLLGSTNGIYRYSTLTGNTRFIPIGAGAKNMQWDNIAEDTATHTVYMSARQGGAICRLSLPDNHYEWLDFQGSNINYLFTDKSMNLWIGTDGAGVYKLDIKPHKFYCYPVDTSYNAPVENGLMVKSIYCDSAGMFWIGSYYKGLLRYDPSSQHLAHVDIAVAGKGPHPVSIIKRDSSGSLLIGFNDRLLWLDPHSFRIKKQLQLTIGQKYASVGVTVYACVEWKKGSYLVGTNQGVYAVADRNGNLSFSRPYTFTHNSITASWNYDLQTTGNGIVYLGTRNGMSKIEMTSDTAFRMVYHAFDNVPVRAFYKSTTTPVLWIASELGLIAYNEATGKYRVFDEQAGMANSYVYAILPQNDTSLWLSTNGGIANMKLQYRGDTVVKAHFDNYTAKDGLQSDEFNTGAYFKCDNGTMIFGGINGINWFDPKMIRPNPYKAMPAIAAIEVNDTIYAADTAAFTHRLSLPYNSNTISFSLRALEYTNPAQNNFAYKLEGLDKDWVYTGNDKVRYADLAPGAYRFLLKVSNNEGAWNDEPLSIDLVILPPFWKTWWFRILLVVVVTGIGYSLVRYYVRQKVRERTRELEKQQALYVERMRISKDVHDDLGSGLSKITLMAELAGKQQAGGAKLKDTIGDISRVSRDLVGNMRDLIWVLNPENTTLDSLVSRIREYCSDYFENMPLQLELDFPYAVAGMHILREAQRNIFLTVKEALNNTVKHAGATNVHVELKVNDNELSIALCDNGGGFASVDMEKGGNGLKNMRQRIETIKGTFHVMTGEGGTSVKIIVPLENIKAAEIPL